jgi:hypothetical protein
MDRQANRLSDHLDANGDLAAPWERFPSYERFAIGWRMGAGEDWMCLWRIFLDTLPFESAIRRSYLNRHPPAPVNWSDTVYRVLHPTADKDEADDVATHRRQELRSLGLIASDAAYPIWLSQQTDVQWPWLQGGDARNDGPIYHTAPAVLVTANSTVAVGRNLAAAGGS